jgi:hypothetical protein
MTNKTKWEVTVEEDPADPESVILPFPEEMLAQLGWVEGDTLNWAVQDDGTVILTKVAAS